MTSFVIYERRLSKSLANAENTMFLSLLLQRKYLLKSDWLGGFFSDGFCISAATFDTIARINKGKTVSFDPIRKLGRYSFV